MPANAGKFFGNGRIEQQTMWAHGLDRRAACEAIAMASRQRNPGQPRASD